MGNRWVPWDVAYFRNPKARRLGKDGRALHLASTCWSAENLQNGFVPTTMLALLCAEAEVKPVTHRLLVTEEAWEVVDGGWQIHDFIANGNQTADEVNEQREKWKRQKAGQRADKPDSPPRSPQSVRGGHRPDSTPKSAESPATDRQTDHDSHLSVTTDDDLHALAESGQSSSSEFNSTIALIVEALVIAKRPDKPTGWRRNTRQNILNEHSAEIRRRLGEGETPLQLAGDWAGGDIFARQAQRTLEGTDAATGS